jgi:hypothetical protein
MRATSSQSAMSVCRWSELSSRSVSSSCCVSGETFAPSFFALMSASICRRIACTGVRSSWAAIEMSVVFMCESASRSVASWSRQPMAFSS